MTGRSAAGPCGGGGECQRHLAARVAARDSPAGDGGRTDGVELLMRWARDGRAMGARCGRDAGGVGARCGRHGVVMGAGRGGCCVLPRAWVCWRWLGITHVRLM